MEKDNYSNFYKRNGFKNLSGIYFILTVIYSWNNVCLAGLPT